MDIIRKNATITGGREHFGSGSQAESFDELLQNTKQRSGKMGKIRTTSFLQIREALEHFLGMAKWGDEITQRFASSEDIVE